jgi:peroxin-11B
MRLGKPWEHLQAALRAIHTSGDHSEQITTLGRQLGYFGYLSYDTLVWVNTLSEISVIALLMPGSIIFRPTLSS